jgi:hypothetical protein
LAYDGKRHEAGDLYTELEYIDARAKRFVTTVERWQAEVDAEIADNEE